MNSATLQDLERILASLPQSHTLTAERVHGILSGALSGPQPLEHDDLLTLVFGDEQESGQPPLARENAHSLQSILVTLCDEIEADIENEEYTPLIKSRLPDSNLSDPSIWAQGFVFGAGYWSESMRNLKDDSELMQYLGPIIYFTGEPAISEAIKNGKSPQEIRELENEFFELLPDCVLAVREFWSELGIDE
jgi:yecA family protein